MPRLNYGTLLENIVVLESTRVCLDHLTADEPLGVASAFAMPPLTRCWCKPAEDGSNPWFNHAYLLRLAARHSPPESIQRMWSLCMNNAPNLQVRPFHHGDQPLSYASAGPNGALLASMLAVQRDREIHLWINDNAERYGEVPPPLPGTQGGPSDTLTAAGLLLGTAAAGTASEVTGWFPDTMPRLAQWLAQGPGRNTRVRIGFLDPDNYAEGQTQVSPSDHRHWLRVLATGSANVLSATFSGCQNRGSGNAARNQRLASFQSDEVALYPQSLVFEYGNFQTGVKVRWPADSSHRVVVDLRHRVETAWHGWNPSMGALTVHINGQCAH